ncbi:MAG: AbfB domain-containing protein, partial [Dolichospermum sp.]
FRKDATFCPRRGLSNKGGTSYESYNFPGYYIRHRDFELWLDKFDGSSLFRDDASFLRKPTL